MADQQNETSINEHAADDNVAAILHSAAVDPALSQPAAGDMPAAPEALPSNNAADAKELLEFAHDSLAPLYPRAVAIYTPDIRERLSLRIGALMDKYGLSCGGMIEQWGAEIGLLVTLVPLIGKTAQAVAADNAAWQAAQAQENTGKTEADVKGGQTPIVDKPAPGELYAKA
jgi:hypothetical protein